MTPTEKARENRLRYRAGLFGFTLRRSRCRTPGAAGYGKYRLERISGSGSHCRVATVPVFDMDLEAVEAALKGGS